MDMPAQARNYIKLSWFCSVRYSALCPVLS